MSMRRTTARALGQRIGQQAHEAETTAERLAILEQIVLLLVAVMLDERKPKDVAAELRELREQLQPVAVSLEPEVTSPASG